MSSFSFCARSKGEKQTAQISRNKTRRINDSLSAASIDGAIPRGRLCLSKNRASAGAPSSNWPVTYSPTAGPCLKPCPTRPPQTHVFHFRMPVNQKIPARSVLILTDARFHNRRIFQCRKPPRHILSHQLRHPRRNNPRLRVRINSLSMFIKRNLQSPPFDVRHSVNQVFLKSQVGSAGAANLASPAGIPKKNTSCREGKIRAPRTSGKTLPSHGPHANTNSPAAILSPRLVIMCSTVPASRGFIACARRYSTRAEPHLQLRRPPSPRHQDTALRFKDAASNAVKPNLRIALLQRSAAQLLECHSASF